VSQSDLSNASTSPTERGSPAVSVVVCVHNGARDLPRLFSALALQTVARERFEVLVVDDASTDATPELAERESGVRLIRAPEHIGLPRARNVGMAEAAAPLIALTDADTTPEPRWIELGIRRFEDSGADMLAGGIVVPVAHPPSIAELLDASSHFDQEDYVKRGFGAGANLWLRRDLLERVGGFNERLAAYGGDDNEFGQRATAAGAQLVYAPEVRLSHPPRDLRGLIRKRYLLGFGLAAHRRHNPGPTGQTPCLYRTRKAYWPPHAIKVGRMREAGYHPSRPDRARLRLARWLFLQLPQIYGDVRGEMAFRRLGR